MMNSNRKKEINSHSLSKKVSLFVFTMLSSFLLLQAKTINFDAVYGNSGNLNSKIQQAINEAVAGDEIIFNSTSYNLGGLNITINKGLTFQGLNPTAFNASTRGATGIRTTFMNSGDFAIRSNNVIFRNLSIIRNNQGEDIFDILMDARHPDYLMEGQDQRTQRRYSGLNFQNVSLSGGAYLLYVGNGVGITMKNVSFLNFRRIAYWVDRKGRINNTGTASFRECVFIPESKVEFDDRGISMDAGNTEYPVIFNLNRTIVSNCRFVDTGIALSRCENMVIEKSTFDDSKGAVDLIHIEEFSNNVQVNENTFNCTTTTTPRSKIIFLDRELQISRNVTINNNTVTGTYNFFISSYAPQDITITNNNFVNANSINTSSIDFTFYETRAQEPIPFEFTSDNITIRGNTGLGDLKNKNVTVNLPSANPTFTIMDYTPAQIKINRIDPVRPLIPNGTYEIVNRATGQKLSPGTGNQLTTGTGTNENLRWSVTWKPPYTYIIQNVANSRYLETAAGYTEFNIFNNTPENLTPFLMSYGADAVKPFWCVVKKGDYWEIFPGGNEKQSALATEGAQIKLVFAKVGNADNTRSVKDLGNNAQWKFNEILPPTNTLGLVGAPPLDEVPVSGGDLSGVPIGRTIWLKANNGAGDYVSASEAANAPLRAVGKSIGTLEQFEVIDGGNGTIALKSKANSKYVQARINETDAPLYARGEALGGWEKLIWENKGEGKVSLKSNQNNKYVQARLNLDDNPLAAFADSAQGWETFNWGFVEEEATETTVPDNTAAPAPAPVVTPVSNGDLSGVPIGRTIWLKANNGAGDYVSASELANAPLRAVGKSIGTLEQFEVIDGGDGTIALRSKSNNKYIQARINETDAPLYARGEALGGWEKLIWENKGEGKVSLKSNQNNKYVQARLNLDANPLAAFADSAQGWETFNWGFVEEEATETTVPDNTAAPAPVTVIAPVSNGDLSGIPIGRTIWLKANNGAGDYVSASEAANAPLRAVGKSIGTLEQFEVIDGGDGTIALRSKSNSKYVQARINETDAPLYARGGSVGGWEKLIWENKGEGKVSLKSNQNNKYVQARLNLDDNPLAAFADSAQGWETFNWGFVAGSKNLVSKTINELLSVYPNPANANSVITITGATIGESIVIYNTNGQKISEVLAISENQEVVLEALVKGLYFVRLNGGTLKLIVK